MYLSNVAQLFHEMNSEQILKRRISFSTWDSPESGEFTHNKYPNHVWNSNRTDMVYLRLQSIKWFRTQNTHLTVPSIHNPYCIHMQNNG